MVGGGGWTTAIISVLHRKTLKHERKQSWASSSSLGLQGKQPASIWAPKPRLLTMMSLWLWYRGRMANTLGKRRGRKWNTGAERKLRSQVSQHILHASRALLLWGLFYQFCSTFLNPESLLGFSFKPSPTQLQFAPAWINQLKADPRRLCCW